MKGGWTWRARGERRKTLLLLFSGTGGETPTPAQQGGGMPYDPYAPPARVWRWIGYGAEAIGGHGHVVTHAAHVRHAAYGAVRDLVAGLGLASRRRRLQAVGRLLGGLAGSASVQRTAVLRHVRMAASGAQADQVAATATVQPTASVRAWQHAAAGTWQPVAQDGACRRRHYRPREDEELLLLAAALD